MSQEPERDKEFEIICAALMGLGVVAIVQMLSVERLDVSLKVSVFSFAFSIPSLATAFLSDRADAEFGIRGKHKWLERFMP